jgi:hypothetical protein
MYIYTYIHTEHLEDMRKLRAEHVRQAQSMKQHFITVQTSAQQQHAELEKATNEHNIINYNNHSLLIQHLRQEPSGKVPPIVIDVEHTFPIVN